MEKTCSFFGLGNISCGESRGVDEVVKISSCINDVNSHLATCHLSKSGLSESQLILARSGLFDISPEQIESMTVCASHRHKLGRFWRPLRSCQYPAHSGPAHQYKSRKVFNLQLAMEVQKLFGCLVQIGSPICPSCAGKHSERIAREGKWVRGFAQVAIQESAKCSDPEENLKSREEKLENIEKERCAKDPLNVDDSLVKTPSTVGCNAEHSWTPSCWSSGDDTSDEECHEETPDPVVDAFNNAMKELSEVASVKTPERITFQLRSGWETATEAQKKECVRKATETCKMICQIIAPKAGDDLFQSLQHEEILSNDLIALMTAYAKAPTRNLKTQILSIYAYEYPTKKLQALHEPYAKLSKWQIKKARAHSRTSGPGGVVRQTKRHRISLDMNKVDHFIDFVNRPYFHQDVAFSMRKLKLQSGETIEMPNVIRTVTRSTMVAQYQQFCDEQSFEPLSRSTLFRILEVREATQRKSLSGLDNTAADGSEAFQTMKSIVEQLAKVGVDKSWSTDVEKQLNAGKQYLKTGYKVHCRESCSPCADHCRLFSLSDPCDKELQANCKHLHVATCKFCEDIKSVIGDVERKIRQHSHPLYTKENQEDLLHDFNDAKAHITAWKAHVMRSANQELAKQNVLRNLDESSVLLVMDWAMKFPQIKYREKQSEWYGKKGMSWHVSSVVSKTEDADMLSVTTYVHLFDQTTQDWFAVASILENLIGHTKSSKPLVRKIFLRSDEAGCYHNNLLIAAIKDIADRTGVDICRYDYSEPQQGKDICDRIICPLKSSVRKYCDEGNDVCDAKQMYVACKTHPVRGTSISVARINKSVTHLGVEKIQNFSAYHNFEYMKDGIKVWKAYGIGTGKKFHNKEIYVTHQGPTALEVVQPFTERQNGRKLKINNSEHDDNESMAEKDGLFECDEPGCNYAFSSFDQLELHREIGTHNRFFNNESVYDTLKREWAKKFTTIEGNSSTESSQPSLGPLSVGTTSLQMGWALSKPKTGSIRFSDNVRQYLTSKFDCGEKTGEKANSIQVASEMRTCIDENGNRYFSREEWLTPTQIKGFFSRLTKSRRKRYGPAQDSPEIIHKPVDDQLSDDDDDNEENSKILQENKEFVEQINSTLGTAHPILYYEHDLCELHHQNKLNVFKVPVLKEICLYFELGIKSKDRKADLTDRIGRMVENCTCIRETK